MKRYISHLGFAFRIIAKTPVISILSILVLAISIAQVTTMFNVVSSVLFSQLPYDGGERLYRIERVNNENEFADRNMPFQSYHEFLKLEQVFDGTIALFNDSAILKYENNTTLENCVLISDDFMHVLGEEVMMGRRFNPEDALPESPQVVIISEQIWDQIFGRDPEVIGKSMNVDGIFRTVVGVTHKEFDFPFVSRAWVPLNTETLTETVGWGSSLFFMGKLKPGISEAGATAQLDEVFLRLKETYPEENKEHDSIRLENFKDMMLGDGTIALFVAMGICAILVLLMGCAIVSNLMTVRCAKRANELAIRSALGATRPQIVIQMLFESLLTTIVSIALGWLLLLWFDRAVLANYYSEFNVPSWFFDHSYNLGHVMFIIGVLIIVTVASTLIPALRASKTTLNDLLKDSTRTGSSLRLSILGRLLIVFQIAAAFAVITGGGIVGYFLKVVTEGDRDFNANEYLYGTVTTNAKVHREHQTKMNLFEDIKRELMTRPDVKGVTYSTEFYAGPLINSIKIEGVDYPSTDAYPSVYRILVAPDYFKLMNTPLIAGREFTNLDGPDKPRVVIVTDVFAKKFWGDENPIGKRFSYFDADQEYENTVIGVVKDLFRSDQDRDGRTGFFMAAYQDPWYDIGIHVHMKGNPLALERDLVSIVADIDPEASVTNITTIQKRTEQGLVGLRFIFVMFITFSFGALLMAAAGLYGVVSFSVAQRIREIGIRLALGAAPARVVAGVFGQGFLNVIIGILIGVVLAYGLRYLFMMVLNPLFESTIVYLSVLLGILATSTVSILIPSVRGGATDPAEALRID